MKNWFDIFGATTQPFADCSESVAFLRESRDSFDVLNLSYWFLGASAERPERMVWFSTYDQGYVAQYLRNVTPQRDMAFAVGFRRLLPLDWAELRAMEESVANIHLVAERYGVGRHGISIPIREPGVGDAMFSVNFDCDDRHWCDLRRSLVNDLYLFAHYFHQRSRSVIAARADTSPSELSPREREVLKWAAEGKTARETAELLRVSESAVNLYAGKAMIKLEARTKTHAVAIAVRKGLVA